MSIFNFTCGKRPIRNLPPSLNYAPSFTSFPTISGGSPQAAGTILSVSYAGIGFPTPTPSYVWNLNGSPIPGATAATLNTTGVTGNITVTVTLTNGVAPNAVVTSNTIAMIPPLVAPSFTTTPTISGASAPGNVITVSYAGAGNPAPTPSFVWKNNGVPILGATAATYTSLPSQVLTCEVTLTNGVNPNAVATSNTFTVSAVGAVIAQTATFGAMNFPSEGGWRPQLADGRVENIASYVGLQSGSLGAYTPTIVALGKLAFTGANGAPNGAVLRVTGVSGRVYDVTVVQEANRRDLSSDVDVNRNRTAAYHVGKKVVVRQNAQLSIMNRTISGASFLQASSQAQIDSGLNAPTIFEGEGPRTFDDEWHLHSWRGTPASETTIQRLRFMDQKTHDSIMLEGSSTRRVYNITVRENYIKVFYDIDGTSADWSTGFSSTGFVTTNMIYVTNGGYVSNVDVLDNVLIGGYTQISMRAGGYNDISGNYMRDMYYDFRKQNTSPTFTADRVTFEGANYYSLADNFSVNETLATRPHHDANQVPGGDPGTHTTFSEFNVIFHTAPTDLQTLFHSTRPATETGGFNWNIAGDFYLTNTFHAATNTWPHHVTIDHMMVVPSPVTTLPQANGRNTFRFGASNTIGTHVIKNSTANGIAITQPPSPYPAIAVGLTGFVDSGPFTNADFANNLTRWADWPTLPTETTYADAFSYSQAVAGSPFAAVTPYGHVTPGTVLQSDYTLSPSSTLIMTPVLTGLTVTNPATAAFTATSNLDRTTAMFWNVTSSAWTDPHLIRRGVVGKTGVLAYGINNRVGATGPCIGTGAAAALPPGNYFLNVAVFNGRKKTTVVSVAFTAP